jgi:hypothetical protein
MRELDELWIRFGRGETNSTFDFFALLFFLAFAVVFLIVPVIGYRAEDRARIGYSLYALIAYVGMSVVQMLFFWMLGADQGGFNRGPGGFGRNVLEAFGFGASLEIQLLFLFGVLKMGLLLTAMITFASGLRSLRLRQPSVAPADMGGQEDTRKEREP